MARVKNSVVTRQKRKAILKRSKGYFGSKHRLWKTANEQLMNSGQYAYRDRKQRKRDFRKLWIQRINAGCRENGISYSKFISGLKKADVEINRKMLSEIAIHDKEQFTKLVELAKENLDKKKEVKTEKKESKKEEKKTEKKEDKKDLSKLTVKELTDIAKENNLSGYSTLKKKELIELIEKEVK